MKILELTADEVRRVLSYDPESGELHWKKAGRRGPVKPGAAAGTLHPSGYITVMLHGRCYKAHRLAWLLMMGVWPNGHIDHINGRCADNRWANLRLATRSQNLSNSKLRSDSTTGAKGVSFNKQMQKWIAYVNHKGARYYLGTFADMASAIIARDNKARELHGEFARLNEELSA